MDTDRLPCYTAQALGKDTMAIWAIGDVQGCFEPLQRLLQAIAFDPRRDRIVFAGDLVNRGPDSLGVLQWCAQTAQDYPDSVTSVLGNHDLHLLARSLGLSPAKRRDTLDAVLAHRDDQPLRWLRRQPLLQRVVCPGKSDVVVLHGGLAPAWTVAAAEAMARQAEAIVRGGQLQDLLLALTGVRASLDPAVQRAAEFAGTVTRLRACQADGTPEPGFSGPPEEVPSGYAPWYALPGRQSRGTPLVFGHWAAVGYRRGPDWTCLDSGCVWGNQLTAMELASGRVVQVPAIG